MESMADFIVFSGASFFQGHFWTPLTALFIHADLTHLVGNMIFLYVFGSTLEDEVGAGKTLGAFLVGGVLAFIVSILFYGSNTVMIGASAAIFTLTAAVMLTKPLKFSWTFLMPLGLVALLYFVYNVVAVVSVDGGGNVGYFGHITGFAVGVPLGISWSRRKWIRNLLIAVALLIAYSVIVHFLSSFLEQIPSPW